MYFKQLRKKYGKQKEMSLLQYRWLLYLVCAYLSILLFMYLYADYYIFPRPVSSYHDDKSIIKIKTKDGEIISAVYLPNSQATYTVLISHGNGEDVRQMSPFLKRFQQQGFSVFAYDYHGYGTSTGIPSEKNAYLDEEAAYRYLTEKLGTPTNRIILYGRSLGSALAVDLATHKPVAGVIIESPFISAFRLYTRIPILLFDKFNNLKKINKIKAPILIIHGKNDRIIPLWHGEKLYKQANATTFFCRIESANHNDVEKVGGESYWQSITDFTHFISSSTSNTA